MSAEPGAKDNKGLEVVVFIGLQASGKSSFYRQHFASTHVHISKDLMRNNRNKERRQSLLVEEALSSGRSVVVDNTNATVADREPLIALARQYGARVVGYYFQSLAGECIVRNQKREGRARVPNVAIFATLKKLEPPSPAEGYDRLLVVRLDEECGFTTKEWNPEEQP